ncbi:hypothetical protein OUZ56_012171 [Daphnia magna]|uniref:Uncharacterized protein n=1 Tax=Daphnia magna TaxID=35525 RepID=A0ABQ9Z287_9CRUS|nr:hypothetical protein OUZ56_012171 [Daphnia magna]
MGLRKSLELQVQIKVQKEQIKYLDNRVKEYNKLQIQFIETEDCNDSKLTEDEPGEKTKLVGDINKLTMPKDSGDKSLPYELDIEQTNDYEQKIDDLKTPKQDYHLFGTRKLTNKKEGRHGRNTW